MNHEQRLALSGLLSGLFGDDNEDLLGCLRLHPAVDRSFLAGLPPAGGAAPATFQWKVIERLSSFGLVDAGLFSALVAARGPSWGRIAAVARLFGVESLEVDGRMDGRVEEAVSARRRAGTGGILMMCADAEDPAVPLRLVQEQRAVLDALAAGRGEGLAVVIEPQVSYGEAVRVLVRHQPKIWHFGGHGRPGGRVIFAGGVAVGPASMAEIFRVIAAPPELVVFACCDSAAMAAAVSMHVDFAIGFDGELGDAGAAEGFSKALYGLLVEGVDVPRAFALARNTASVVDPSAGLARLFRGGEQALAPG
jgi:hypothetical protein